MPRPSPLPASLDPSGFTVGDGFAAGVTRRRMRASDLEAPFRGIRTQGSRTAARERALAYAPRLREGDAFSHGTALAMIGVDVPTACIADVHVVTTAAHERVRGAGTRGHEASAGRLRIGAVRGVPTVHPVDAWCLLAEELTVHELVIVGDALVRRHQPVAELRDLHETVRRWSGRRGVRRLREALELVRERTDSRRETTLRLDAADAGLPEPEVNGRIDDEDGGFVAFGDLVYRDYRTILEYDGEQHRLDDAQFARDVRRLDDLARLGWRVVRVTKADRGRARFAKLARVRESLIAHGWMP